jgi:hypothetical protein
MPTTAGTIAATSDSSNESSRTLLILVAPLAALAVLLARPAGSAVTLCPFAIVTDHACPLCGGTRAAAALMRGDLESAWQLHPLIFVVAVVAGIGWFRWLGAARGWWTRPHPNTIHRTIQALGVLFVVVWIARAMAGTLPPV